MARDIKWAVKEAEEQGAIHRISVEDSTKKEITSSAKKTALGMFAGSIALLIVATIIVVALYSFGGIILHGARMFVIYLIILIFPFYAIYNIIHTSKAIKNDDVEFFQGTLVTKTDKGYRLSGLEDHDLSFLKGKTKDLKAGETVTIVRIADDVSLFV